MFNFTDEDKIRALIYLQKKISREDLSNELELGEGSIRTILNQLKKEELIKSTKQGHMLNEKGNNFVDNLFYSEFIKINLNIFKDQITYALIVKKHNNPKINYKLRDIAVRNGAESALIMYDDLKIEGFNFENLKNKIKIKEKEILIIVSAKSKRISQNSILLIAKKINKL